jgi:hypothetical protein
MDNIKEELKRIETSLKKILVKNSYEKSGIHPINDWEIVLLVFFIGLVLSGAVTFYLNSYVKSGNFSGSTTSDQSVPVYKVNQKNLSAVTDYFSQKEKKLNDIQSNPKTFADPSL